jgi:predicted nucleic acid-binding protein
VAGLTLDTGALIAIERRSERMWLLWRRVLLEKRRMTVPSVVVVEWWRGQRGPISRLLDGVTVEPLSFELARIAGEALVKVPGASVTDAVVMASAAQRGDIVYTADMDDLSRLALHFPGVRLLGV